MSIEVVAACRRRVRAVGATTRSGPFILSPERRASGCALLDGLLVDPRDGCRRLHASAWSKATASCRRSGPSLLERPRSCPARHLSRFSGSVAKVCG
ncbi:hypothetical protein, partial [uncultured Albimonas sp.]|uniref:hypothetical protein n=1 Tax=uncultured Albimonas sp. TaxID=1331701 RepID=UPI0030EBCEBF